jgi:prevent-host-death family protein
MPNTVTAAWAKAHLPELLNEVEKGETIVISRYSKPVAVISPVAQTEKPVRRFGGGKGRVKLIDPNAFDPMTDEEVDALLKGRY